MFDYLIRNAAVLDGSGTDAYPADVALSGGTIAIMIDWRVALVVWGGFLILAALTKWVSLGSIWAGASFPFATWFVYHDVVLLALAILLGGLIVWKHRGNLKRILNGTESKFSLHHKKDEGAPKA